MIAQRMIVAGVVVVVLGACASAAEGPEASGATGEAEGMDDVGTPESTSRPSGESDERPASPLAEYLGEGFSFSGAGVSVSGSASEGSAEDARKQREVEDLVAQCMREHGFEYIPREPAESGPDEFDEAFALSPEEFAREYGYGISTLGELDAGAGDDSDPNKEIRDGLSAQAQEEYDDALWGDMPVGGTGTVVVQEGDDADGPAEEEFGGEQGCYGEAAAEVYEIEGGPPGDVDFEQFDSLFEDLSVLHQRIQDDPRLDEPRQHWADCMADAGFLDFERPEDAMETVLERMTGLSDLGEAEQEHEQAESDGRVFEEPSMLDPEQLAELRDYEIGVAVADHECRQDGYAQAYRTVQFEHEQEFVDQHPAELESYRDAFAGTNG